MAEPSPPNPTRPGGPDAPAPSSGSVALVFGRAADCDVVLDHTTVSSRHARLVLASEGLVLEDLGSTNGTFVAGTAVRRALVRTGDDVRLGAVLLPWSDPRGVAFVRRATPRGTLVMSPAQREAATATAKGKAAAGSSTGRSLAAALSGILVLVAVGGAALYVVWRSKEQARTGSASSGPGVVDPPETVVADPASAIRATRAAAIAAAIDPTSAETRNTAVKLASGESGPFHVEQVARIWSHVRGRWRYVNDPHGAEYFAKASETIANDYSGDCDDFAIVLASMVTAIGGEARVVLMDGPEGGHAYAEACIRMPPDELATRLSRYYRRKWDPYLGRQRLTQIHFRSSDTCPVWLNLDWNALVPGGQYANERWAVAVAADGTTTALAPAGGTAQNGASPTTTVRAAALPPPEPSRP